MESLTITDSKNQPKYVSVPVETITEESFVNGMGSGDSSPFLLGNSNSPSGTINLPVLPSKRVGGYLQPVPVGCLDQLLPTASGTGPQGPRISAIVQPIFKAVQYTFHQYGLIFGCNEKPSTDSCGMVIAKIMCSGDESHPAYFKHERCNDPGCPKCYTKFSKRIANAVVERVQGYRSVFGYDPVYHLIFWPDSRTGYTSLKDAFKDAKFLLGQMNAKMAVAWYHPYRIRPEIKEQLRRYRRENGISQTTGFWQMAHDDVLGLGDLSAYLVYGPHFHAIASGYLVPSKEYAKREIGGYKKVHVLSQLADLERVAYYISTHACREAGKSTVRYFGKISYSKLARNDGQEAIEDVVCEKCGASMKSHYCNDLGETSGVIHPHITRKVTRYLYWKRGDKPAALRKTEQEVIAKHEP